MNGTCGTCRFWKDMRPDAFGFCERIPEWEDNKAETLAYLSVSEDGQLCTRAEFGCVLHQPVEETP